MDVRAARSVIGPKKLVLLLPARIVYLGKYRRQSSRVQSFSERHQLQRDGFPL